MNTQEIQEQLQDNQEVTIKLGERMTIAEEILAKLMDVKDYSRQLDELKELIIKIDEQDKTAPLQEEISHQVIAMRNLMLSSEASIVSS
jgi:Lhr-like helicase